MFFFLLLDSNKSMSDVLEEFQEGGRLSNYNTDGVSTIESVLIKKITICGSEWQNWTGNTKIWLFQFLVFSQTEIIHFKYKGWVSHTIAIVYFLFILARL